jgi:hypothetical protein
VLEAVYTRDSPLMSALRRYDATMAAAARGDVNERDMAEALEAMDALQGWDTESKVAA